MDCDVSFGVYDVFVVVHILLDQFRFGDGFFKVKFLKVVSEVGFNASEFFGPVFFEFFIQRFDLGFLFEVFEINFVVADDLVEFLTDHNFDDRLSFEG